MSTSRPLRWIAAPIVALSALLPGRDASSDTDAGKVVVKALIVTSTGDEAAPFIDGLGLKTAVAAPGLSAKYPGALCNDDGVCLLTTGPGKASAGASVAALIDSEALDLSSAWFIVAGVAAIDPSQGTVGTVAWATNVVDSGIAWEIDARTLPSGWTTGYLGILSTSPTDKPPPQFGTELSTLDAKLADKALALSSTVTLEDDPTAQAYRASYGGSPAIDAPKVIACDTATSDTYAHGALLGQRLHDYTALLTDGKGTYCTMQQSDNAVLEAIARGAAAGLLDAARVAVVHGAIRFDRPHPGQSAYDSLNADAGGGTIATKNLYLTTIAVIADVVTHWSAWQAGVPQ